MSVVKIANKVYRLNKSVNIAHGLQFNAGQEFEIVMDVVYMGGFPLPSNLQTYMFNWITGNPELFKDDTRIF
jgi:hypothetical protein